jgi:hypothetical protein
VLERAREREGLKIQGEQGADVPLRCLSIIGEDRIQSKIGTGLVGSVFPGERDTGRETCEAQTV